MGKLHECLTALPCEEGDCGLLMIADDEGDDDEADTVPGLVDLMCCRKRMK